MFLKHWLKEPKGKRRRKGKKYNDKETGAAASGGVRARVYIRWRVGTFSSPFQQVL